MKKQQNENLWDAAKVALRGKFIALNALLEKKIGIQLIISILKTKKSKTEEIKPKQSEDER